MMVSSVVSSQVGVVLAQKMSYRNTMLPFGVVFLLGTYLLTTITPDTSHWTITFYMILTGLGIGATFSVLNVASMQPFGNIQKNVFATKLTQSLGSQAQAFGKLADSDPHVMLSPALRVHIPGPILEKLTVALSSSISRTFMWTLIPAGLALVLVFIMNRERMDMGPQTEGAESF